MSRAPNSQLLAPASASRPPSKSPATEGSARYCWAEVRAVVRVRVGNPNRRQPVCSRGTTRSIYLSRPCASWFVSLLVCVCARACRSAWAGGGEPGGIVAGCRSMTILCHAAEHGFLQRAKRFAGRPVRTRLSDPAAADTGEFPRQCSVADMHICRSGCRQCFVAAMRCQPRPHIPIRIVAGKANGATLGRAGQGTRGCYHQQWLALPSIADGPQTYQRCA